MANAKVLAAQDRKVRAEQSFCAETKAALEARLEAADQRKKAGATSYAPPPLKKKVDVVPPADRLPEVNGPVLLGAVAAVVTAVAAFWLRA